jgi:hypothetical protein
VLLDRCLAAAEALLANMEPRLAFVEAGLRQAQV